MANTAEQATATIQEQEEQRRQELGATYPEVMNTEQFVAAYEAESFLAPVVFVTRKADGQSGTMRFDHWPRLYYGFEPVE